MASYRKKNILTCFTKFIAVQPSMTNMSFVISFVDFENFGVKFLKLALYRPNQCSQSISISSEQVSSPSENGFSSSKFGE